MKVTKKDLKDLFDLVEGVEYPLHFVAGVNQVGGVKYYYHDAPPNMLYFLKATPFVPNFYRWGMSQKNLFPIHEEERTIRDVSTYTPQGKKNKIFKNLILNLQRDFENRRLPVATPKMKLLPPQMPSPQRTPVSGDYSPIGTDITFDSFIDPAIVSKLKYKPSMYNVQPEEAIGWVLFTDPNITKPINEAKVFYYNPFGYAYNSQNRYGCKYVGNVPHTKPQNPDIIDIAMVMFGVCPKKNPMLKKILAYDLAKNLEKAGIRVDQSGNKLVIHFAPSMFTGNIFGKWAKKLVREVRKLGKKFEKSVTSPIRDMLKKKAPGVWGVIDKLDKKLGWNDIVKKYNKTVDVLVKKYGAKLMETAIMSGASYVGANYGGNIGLSGDEVKNLTRATIKVGSGLSSKDKSQLLDVLQNSVNVTDLASGDMKAITGNILTNVKNEMIGQKGTEGEDDWNTFRDTLGSMIKDAKGEAKKIFDQNVAPKIAPIARTSEQYKEMYSAFFKEESKPKVKESQIESVAKKELDDNLPLTKREDITETMKKVTGKDLITYQGLTYDEAIDKAREYEQDAFTLVSIPSGWRLPVVQKHFDTEYEKAGIRIPFENKKFLGKRYDDAFAYAEKMANADLPLGKKVPFYWEEPYVKQYFDNYANKLNRML